MNDINRFVICRNYQWYFTVNFADLCYIQTTVQSLYKAMFGVLVGDHVIVVFFLHFSMFSSKVVTCAIFISDL